MAKVWFMRPLFNRSAHPPMDNDAYARLFVEKNHFSSNFFRFLNDVEIERDLLDDLLAQAHRELVDPHNDTSGFEGLIARNRAATEAEELVQLLLLHLIDTGHPQIHPKNMLEVNPDQRVHRNFRKPAINALLTKPGHYQVDPDIRQKTFKEYPPFFTRREAFMDGVGQVTFAFGLIGVGIYQTITRKWGRHHPQI